MRILDFLQYQVLGMKWLQVWTGSWLIGFGLDIDSGIGSSIHFFLYDVIKITILLAVLIWSITYIQSYFPPVRSKEIISRFKGLSANLVAALVGTVTPFCSCSSIPIFIGFTGARVPVGVTFSFLISSPMVDLGSVVLLMSIFGLPVSMMYVLLGLVLAVIGGWLIEYLGMGKYVLSDAVAPSLVDGGELGWRDRIKMANEQLAWTFKQVFPYVVVGVGIGAFIHNQVPAIWVERLLGANNGFGVWIATMIGIPMYADIFGMILVAEVLLDKGAQLGTILAFMMAVTTLSLPSLVMLSKVVQKRLLAVFVGICGLGIILIGYVFNAWQTGFI